MIRWLYRKLRHDHESLLALLIAARRKDQERLQVALIFRAGYRVGQLNRGPLDRPDYEI